MEVYIEKLSECQKRENQLREERVALIRAHEKALEELNTQIEAIFRQRNHILEQFKGFLEPNDATETPGNKPQQVEPERPKLRHLPRANTIVESFDANYLSAATTPVSVSSTPSPTYHSVGTVSPVAPEEPARPMPAPARPYKFVHRLKPSKSDGSLLSGPSALTVQSPTTTQIESMLSKVRTNVHSLDSKTMSQCIDLLSSRITKDRKESTDGGGGGAGAGAGEELLYLPTPTPTSMPANLELIKPLVPEIQRPPVEAEQQQQQPAASQSPKQPSSPKKPIETQEERRARIERVLFGEPKVKKSALAAQQSTSTLSLNELNFGGGGSGVGVGGGKSNEKESNKPESRYSSRRSKIKRNHSLSPLRFCLKTEQARNQMLGNSKKTDDQIRRFRSEQLINMDSYSLDSLNIEEDLSASDCVSNVSSNKMLQKSMTIDGSGIVKTMSSDEDSDDDNEEAKDVDVDGNDKESDEDHLLAPSKVVKSQDLFQQVFFPSDLRQKPLMTKEELAKTRTGNVFVKRQAQMIHSHSDGNEWRTESESPENSLSVDYLSHLRRNSASPEQRMRTKELTALGNTKKFRCFQDFWEAKTKETIDKKLRNENWQNQPQQQQQQPTPHSKPTAKVSASIEETAKKLKAEELKNVVMQSKAKPERVVKRAELQRQQPVMANMQQLPWNQMQHHQQQQQQQQHQKLRQQFQRPAEPTVKTTPAPGRIQSNPEHNQNTKVSPGQMNTDNDKILEKLRHFQDDIRQRRFKQQTQHFQPKSVSVGQSQMVQQQPQPKPKPQPPPRSSIVPNLSFAHNIPTIQNQSPSPYGLKTFDYPLSPNAIVPKSAAVKVVQPGSPEIPTKNRIRLIRSYARDEPDEPEVAHPRQPAFNVAKQPNAQPRGASEPTNAGFRPVNNNTNTTNTNNKPKQTFTTLLDQHQGKRADLLSLESANQMRSTYF